VLLAKVNIDESPKLAAQYQVQGIPLVVAFRQGKPVAEFAGARPEAFVRQFVKQVLPSESEKLAAHAQSLEASDPAQAELAYLQALDRDRGNESAAIGLARLMLGRGQEKEALVLLEEVSATEETDRLKAMAGLRQLAKTLGDEHTLRQRVEKEPNNANARYELGCILAVNDKHADALAMLLSAAELDPKLAASVVCEAMLKVFQIVGLHSELANNYRNKLSVLLF